VGATLLRATDKLGGATRILDLVGHGFWMPKLRVVESRICRGSGEREAGLRPWRREGRHRGVNRSGAHLQLFSGVRRESAGKDCLEPRFRQRADARAGEVGVLQDCSLEYGAS